ncbi:ubiquitin-like domain-containing protein [Indiicoccus explosivorum]|uniref:ubiquitin-like domain-containing protein n=1 Tax=Indiicoccus explosivorum TaxID=1917864 RepID=UPI000B44A901|nr:ubiquitin-like domain-containing protein [Indiicoccus explosivorum]
MSAISSRHHAAVNNKRKLIFSGLLLLLVLGCISLLVHESSKQTVTFYAYGETLTVRTHALTVGDFLKEQGVGYSEHDYIFPSAGQPVTEGMEIEWTNAEQYAITLEDKKITAWATSSRVKDILEKADISLSANDTVTPALNEKVDAGDLIRIEKVRKNEMNSTAVPTYSASR